MSTDKVAVLSYSPETKASILLSCLEGVGGEARRTKLNGQLVPRSTIIWWVTQIIERARLAPADAAISRLRYWLSNGGELDAEAAKLGAQVVDLIRSRKAWLPPSTTKHERRRRTRGLKAPVATTQAQQPDLVEIVEAKQKTPAKITNEPTVVNAVVDALQAPCRACADLRSEVERLRAALAALVRA